MKTKALALAFALLGFAFAPSRAVAEAEVSFQFFYDSLSPLGEWIEVGDYGEAWQPTGVDEDWSPYTDGYWSYTDAGWTWVSYEDFGGITYHYGRWVRAEDVGWCWVPDTEWGPAWVSWRNSEEHIGWAPLPPEATFTASVGISTWVDDSYDIGPDYYNFCPIVEFGAPLIRTVCVPRFERVRIYSGCVNVTNISYNSHSSVVFCGGPSFTYINSRSRRSVPALKLVQNFNVTNISINKFNNYNQGNTLQVYAPKIVKNKTVNIINKPKITKVVAKEKVRRGWDVVKDPEEKQRLRAKVKQESKGLTAETAPARKVKPEELKMVPAKADVKAPSPIAKGRNRRDDDGDGIANRKDKDDDGDGVKDNQKPGKIAGANGEKADKAERQPGEKMPGKVGVDSGDAAAPDLRKDKDGDGIPNRRDKDRDGDGVKDRQPGKAANERTRAPESSAEPRDPASSTVEGSSRSGKVRRDDDGDGIANRFDNDDRAPKSQPGNGNLRKRPNSGSPEDRDPTSDKPAKRGGFQGNGAAQPDRPDRPDRAERPTRPDVERPRRDPEQQDSARRQAAMAERQQAIERQQRQLERTQQPDRPARPIEREPQSQQRAPERSLAERQARQAERQQQQMERPQVQRAPQQMQRPPAQQQVPRQGGGGGQGRGKRNLTPEELEALKQQRGR